MSSVPLLDHTAETVVIMGGGPAGISCALWLKNLGHRPVILESLTKPGGTPGQIDRPNRWIAGMPEINSRDLARQMLEQCSGSEIEVVTGVDSISLESEKPFRFSVRFKAQQGNQHLDCSAIVVATGVKPRGVESLGFAIPDALLDRFDTDPLGHLTGRNTHSGERALVLGGADNAFFTANDLLNSGATVTLACRSLPKAQSLIQSKIKTQLESGTLQILSGVPDRILQTETGIQVGFRGETDSHDQEFDQIYLRTGFVPKLDRLKNEISQLNLPLDQKGFPELDGAGRWNDRGIYCCGDLDDQRVASVVSALSGGANVAKSIEEDLRRSAS
ncbi:MAG: NAD(P)/FAD-dependent oxidoreductase [Planctomycetota bacterium]